MNARECKLTPKQERFVAEYLIDLNATAAYKRAGYAAKGNAAEVNAARLLRNAQVAAAVAAAQGERAGRLQITADRVLEEVAALAFSDVGEVLDFTAADPRLRPACDIPERARRALSSVKVKRYFEGTGDDAREVEVTEFKLWDKGAALEKLGRHLGLFPNKVEHSGQVRVAAQAAEMTDEELAAIAAAHQSRPGRGRTAPKKGRQGKPA